MSGSVVLLCVLAIGIVAFLLGRLRANALAGPKLSNLHSRPVYYGGFVAIWATLPALLLLAFWSITAPSVIQSSVRGSFPAEVLAAPQAEQNLEFGMITSIARGMKLLSPADAARLQVQDGQKIAFSWGGNHWQCLVRVSEHFPTGLVGLPLGLPPLPQAPA